MYTYIRMYTYVCIHIRIGSRAEEEAFILRMSAREHSIRSFLGLETNEDSPAKKPFAGTYCLSSDTAHKKYLGGLDRGGKRGGGEGEGGGGEREERED
mmetsp:Transcript_24019/g.38651  ORF Transcript_24019/g.38651 Transcript_24019/m.38651 type:complete len:98 (+) Transcript_24019:2-295(+)